MTSKQTHVWTPSLRNNTPCTSLWMIRIIPAQITVTVSSACLLRCLKSLVHPTNFTSKARHGRVSSILLAVTYKMILKILLHNRKGGDAGDVLEFSTSSLKPKTEGRMWETSPGSRLLLKLWVLKCNNETFGGNKSACLKPNRMSLLIVITLKTLKRRIN